MTFRRFVTARGLLAAICITSAVGLGGCSSLNSFGDISEYANSDLDTAPPREFITDRDVAKIKVGMTPLEIKNRLGPPLLMDASTYARFDQFSLFNIFPRTDKRVNDPMVYNYVLRDMSSGKAEFVAFAVNFQKRKFLGLIETVSVKSFGRLETPAVTKFETPATLAAAATTTAIPESEPVVAAPTAAAPEAVPAATSADAAADDIVKVVQAWAQAWAGKDADAYISHYTADFDNGMGGRSKWEAQRRQRLSNPQSITLSLSDIRITPKSDTLAEVSFRQEYASNMFKENGKKTLLMTKADGQWKIRRETFSKR